LGGRPAEDSGAVNTGRDVVVVVGAAAGTTGLTGTATGAATGRVAEFTAWGLTGCPAAPGMGHPEAELFTMGRP
jgi:hypothetical protein